MYNIKLESYVPEPSPATPDRIVAAHYYAAWKYGAAEVHEGFNDLAEIYPDRTPLMGYYDEENPEVCDQEIKWAVEHGIHEALFHAKYQNYMKFALMFEIGPLWSATDEKDMLENLMPFWMENYFNRDNYLKIDNKPVLFFFNPKRLAEECFSSAERQKATFDACREYCRAHGFDGMVFAPCNTELTKTAAEDTVERGFDFRFGYNSGYRAPVDYYNDEDDIVKKQWELYQQRLENDPMRFVPTASCFADATPRHTERWRAISSYPFYKEKRWYLSPENFRRVLEGMKEISDALPDGAWGKKIIMIDNRNKWDEGHFVAPSHKFGYKYLQAIREVFTKRDNLPDYRTPQDQGFTGYNQSWKTPDFAEFCKEKYK